MKRFIKNNLKVFVTLVISGIVFTGIGVYAASQYLARDISFTPTNENFKKENGEAIDNVEEALNELYNKKVENENETKDEVTIVTNNVSMSTQISQAQIITTTLNFKYAKLVKINKSGSVSSCYVYAYSMRDLKAVELKINDIVNLKDEINIQAIYSELKSTANGSRADCNFILQFYN